MTSMKMEGEILKFHDECTWHSIKIYERFQFELEFSHISKLFSYSENLAHPYMGGRSAKDRKTMVNSLHRALNILLNIGMEQHHKSPWVNRGCGDEKPQHQTPVQSRTPSTMVS